MSDLEKEMPQSEAAGGLFDFLRQRKSWWLVPLAVLCLLLGILYVLGHMSSADPETYPTTRGDDAAAITVC